MLFLLNVLILQSLLKVMQHCRVVLEKRSFIVANSCIIEIPCDVAELDDDQPVQNNDCLRRWQSDILLAIIAGYRVFSLLVFSDTSPNRAF